VGGRAGRQARIADVPCLPGLILQTAAPLWAGDILRRSGLFWASANDPLVLTPLRTSSDVEANHRKQIVMGRAVFESPARRKTNRRLPWREDSWAASYHSGLVGSVLSQAAVSQAPLVRPGVYSVGGLGGQRAA
jgi:hypothetical protein